MAEIKDEDIANLPSEKQELLRMAASFADKVSKNPASKGRSMWLFHFHEGAYQGETVIGIRQDCLTSRAVIGMLEEVNWPGFKVIVKRAEAATLSVLRAEADARGYAKAKRAGEQPDEERDILAEADEMMQMEIDSWRG